MKTTFTAKNSGSNCGMELCYFAQFGAEDAMDALVKAIWVNMRCTLPGIIIFSGNKESKEIQYSAHQFYEWLVEQGEAVYASPWAVNAAHGVQEGLRIRAYMWVPSAAFREKWNKAKEVYQETLKKQAPSPWDTPAPVVQPAQIQPPNGGVYYGGVVPNAPYLHGGGFNAAPVQQQVNQPGQPVFYPPYYGGWF